MAAMLRELDTTCSHMRRPSQKRSFAVFVRKTNSKPKAVPTKVCAVRVKDGNGTNLETSVNMADHSVKLHTGVEIRHNKGECGQVKIFLNQSRVE
mmetsp:Transcript_132718/g.264858  ORF Transcript_132718/g.264858 Transcript_132718/m.264858 type:complete len:95 (-) Transcript_132718:407-691(-)